MGKYFVPKVGVAPLHSQRADSPPPWPCRQDFWAQNKEQTEQEPAQQLVPTPSHGAQAPCLPGLPHPCIPCPPKNPRGCRNTHTACRRVRARVPRDAGTSAVSSASACLPRSQSWLCEICAGGIRLIPAPVQSRREMHRLAVPDCILMVRELTGSREEKGKEPDCSSWLPAIDLLPGLLMNV